MIGLMKTLSILAILFAFGCGIGIGRYSVPTTSVAETDSSNSEIDIAPHALAGTAEPASEKKSAVANREESSSPKRKKRYSNVRKQGDSFKLGALDARFLPQVVRRYSGSPDEHYQVSLEVTNQTEGRLLKPQVWTSSVKDNFGNACKVEVSEGGFAQMFGGRDPNEIGPSETERFTFLIHPRIETATKFKGAISFDGTGSSWSRPSFYFRIVKDETKFTESSYEDEATATPHIRLGQPIQVQGYEVTAKNVSRTPSPSGNDKGVNRHRITVGIEVANTGDEEKRAYLSFDAHKHLGDALNCGTLGQSSGGDQNGILLKSKQSANFIRYIDVPEEHENTVVHCSLKLSESGWESDPPTLRLRIAPDMYEN